MAETVASYAQSTFTAPVSGDALDPSVVLSNENALRTKFNSHDADSGIHFQSSVAASKPAAGTAGRKWYTTDTKRIYYDNGSTWDEIAYLGSAGGTLTGALTVSSGGIAVTGDSTITGTLGGVTTLTCTTVTATNLGGTLSTAAQTNVTSLGTLTALTIGGNLTFSGASRRIKSGTTNFGIERNADTSTWLMFNETSSDVYVGRQTNAGTVYLGNTTYSSSGGNPCMTVTGGVAPTGNPGSAGIFCFDEANFKLYIHVGSGTWKSVTLS